MVERSEKKNQVLVLKFLEISSWFSSVYSQNIDIVFSSFRTTNYSQSCFLLESLETCFLVKSIREFSSDFSPPAVVYIKSISILLNIFIALLSSDIEKNQLEKACDNLWKIVKSNESNKQVVIFLIIRNSN